MENAEAQTGADSSKALGHICSDFPQTRATRTVTRCGTAASPTRVPRPTEGAVSMRSRQAGDGGPRQPVHKSDRIGIRECSWKGHDEFFNDIRRVVKDAQTWSAIKTMMRRAAAGTAREVRWEYPCASSTGMIGELKHTEHGEVEYSDPAGNTIVESADIHYRVYFNEPRFCPAELWAMGAGTKSLHPQFEGTDQQDDIEIAVLRASQTTPGGTELHSFNP